MILTENNYKTKSNLPGTSTFQIQSSSKAFKILSSNLYKDKITAVIRELSTNAVDAHIANGCKSQIKIHVPTLDEPTFVVTDKGIGMDENEIHKLYTTYFSSNKSDSNDYTGALGLGSKSPFAYTDQFIVESSKNGVKNVFSCFLNNDAMPTLSKVSTSIDLTTGTKVTVPVQVDDIREFKKKIIRVYEYFTQMPDIDDKELMDNLKLFRNKEIAVSGKEYAFIVDHRRDYSDASVYVVMGGIKYPVAVKDIPQLQSIPLVRSVKRRYSYELILKVEIGLLDIAPSREELSYDRRTLANLTLLLQRINAQFESDLVKRVEGCKTEKERVEFIHKNMIDFVDLEHDKLKFEKKTPNVMALYELTAKTYKSPAKLRRTKPNHFTIDCFRATYFAVDPDHFQKNKRRQRVLAYLLEHNLDRAVLVAPEDVEDNYFIQNGSTVIQENELPEIKVTPRIKSAKSLTIDAEWSVEGDSRKTYYMVSNRNKIPMLGGYTSVKSWESFVSHLNLNVAVFTTQQFRRYQNRIKKNENYVKLTTEKIDQILSARILKEIKDSGTQDFFVRQSLRGEKQVSFHHPAEGVYTKLISLMTEEQRTEMMKIKIIATVCRVEKATNLRYSDSSRAANLALQTYNWNSYALLWKIVEEKLVPQVDAEKIKKEEIAKKEDEKEMRENLIITTMRDYLRYKELDSKMAEKLYNSFVQL